MIKGIVILALFLTSSAIDAVRGDSTLLDEAVYLQEPDDFNRIHHTDLTAYGAYVFQYVKLGGEYDELFDVSYSPQEAYAAYLDSGTNYAVGLNHIVEPFIESLPRKIAEAGRRAFARGATPFTFFKSFVNLYEDYMQKKHILTPDNARHMAYLYYVELHKIIDSMGVPKNSMEKFHTLTWGNIKYTEALGPVTEGDVTYIQERFIYFIDRI